MKTALQAETLIDAAITAMSAKGFMLCTSLFGGEKCGCAITAFACNSGLRKEGESALSCASRLLEVNTDYLWELVNGFDGKMPKRHIHPDSAVANEMKTWYEVGSRLARKWVSK